MALHRGIQSAIFYYLSCAPCADARHRKKRRREADLAKLEKEALEAEGARLDYQYTHTLASNTNPAWDLEIAIGPSKESKAAAKLKAKKDKEADPLPRSSGSTITNSDRTRTTVTSELDHRAKVQWASAFQRSCGEPDVPVPEKAHTSGRSKPALAVTRTATPAWASSPNPPLNDLHPSTVTRFDSPADVSWMLEPPPPARVMRGNEPERRTPYTPRSPTRSRTGTGESRPMMKARSGNAAEAANARSGHVAQQDSTSDDGLYESNTNFIEKQDSAGPAPGRNNKGGYLFPPRDWLEPGSRRDSASGYGADDDDDGRSSTRDHFDPRSAPRQVRWRWSIDW